MARFHYQQAVELAPNDPHFPKLLIEFYIRYNIDLRETAIPLAREMIVNYPNNASALDVMGQVLFRLGDVLTAERYYLRALEKSPGSASAHLHLGILYKFQGADDLAVSHLNQAILLAPNSVISNHAQRVRDE